ncbi:MAG: T9SS type A sorting domain-containing protein [Bacteroidales bacterium]|nr:T9SS type A sorting domain-containing protein [Bacteroidales bacterium]
MGYVRLFLISLLVFLSSGIFVFAQDVGFNDNLITRPERTQYLETSLHVDVMRFVNALDANSDLVHLEIMGTSYQGKDLPLVIMANPKVESRAEAIASGKTLIYIQGNIHGGEVEGKEALMILLREMAFGTKNYLLDNQILLFCPLFNPDGNDALGPNNRSNQDGSPYLAGKRTNGQGFDLNRDGLKLETIEGKALAANVMNKWNPDMFVDLHTTNGTWHGYAITYAPGIPSAGHQGTMNYMNDNLLPWLSEKVRQRAGFDTFWYGGFYEYPPKHFYGMYPEPRYLTNSFALKNKLSLLVETFSHDHFEKRILSNVSFLTSLLEYTNDHADEIRDLISGIENEVVQEIVDTGGDLLRGTEFEYADHPPSGDLLAYEVKSGKHTSKRLWFNNVILHIEHQAAREAKVPKAYVFPAEMTELAQKLQEHGVDISQLANETSYQGEQYSVTQLNNQSRSYQGHYPASLEGDFDNAQISMPADSWYVDMAQPLAYLVFYLLEPEADDGLVFWNYFDDYLKARNVGTNTVAFPVFKVLESSSSIDENSDSDLSITFYSDQRALVLQGLSISAHSKTVELVSAGGQILIHQKIPVSNSYFYLSVSGLARGIYFIRYRQDGEIVTKKVFVSHGE